MAEAPKKFTVKTKFKCIWLKFYAEQIEYYSEELHNDSEILEEALNNVVIGLSYKYVIDAYVHNKDFNKDDMWEPSIEKPHGHLLMWVREEGAQARTRVGTLLKELEKVAHIRFRTEEDETLLEKSTKFPNMRKQEHIKAVVYHTHETCVAKEDDLKVQYPREGRITNLTQEELDSFYRIYEQKYNYSKPKDKAFLLESYCNQAYDLGLTGGDFDKWLIDNIPPDKITGARKTLALYYESGVNVFLASPDSTSNVRCCIFIRGKPNTGKTYNSKEALKALGYSVLPIEAGGTGKLDELKPSHGAIVVSDTSIKNLLAMADNTFTRVYRRNEANPLWCGQYLIITYNGFIREYLEAFYANAFTTDETKQAVYSRFYQAELNPETGELYYKSCSTRGSEEDIVKRAEMALAFKEAYNKSLKTYNKYEGNPMLFLKDKFSELLENPWSNMQIGVNFDEEKTEKDTA